MFEEIEAQESECITQYLTLKLDENQASTQYPA